MKIMERDSMVVLLLCLTWSTQNMAQLLNHCFEEKILGSIRDVDYSEELDYDQESIRENIIRYKYVCSHVIFTEYNALHDISREDSVISITIEDSVIPIIPVGAFNKFTDLSELFLNKNFVNFIQPGAFTSLTALKELYLQDNNITKVGKGIFNSFPHLIILNLSNNNIDSIEEHAFLGLFALKKIYLSKNVLKIFSPDLFLKINELSLIDFSYNFLTDFSFPSYNKFTIIDFSAFPRNLEYLMLQGNQINSTKNWEQLENIRNIDLSNNTLININPLHETLLYFNLSRNFLRELNNSIFNKAEHLNVLDLSHNLIKNVYTDTFLGLHSLVELYLHNNEIDIVPIGCFAHLKSLQWLNLANNEIKEFEYGTFSGLSTITRLDISGNKLTFIQEGTFYGMTNLKVLNIKDNYITFFDARDLKEHAENLELIVLDNNPWKCKTLVNIAKILKNVNVEVVKGFTQNTSNVNGVPCTNYNNYSKSGLRSSDLESHVENEKLTNAYTALNEAKAFKNYFNEDFLNSSFYKYFQNLKTINVTFNLSLNDTFLNNFNKKFEKSTFYKYFDRDFSNDSFFVRFDAVLRKLSGIMSSLDIDFKKSSFYNFFNSNTISNNFTKYFDSRFTNSGFYKYFNKDFSKSEFVKYFDEKLPSKVDSNLLKIRNYFNNDLPNSTFFDSLRSNQANSTNFAPSTAYLTGNENSALELQEEIQSVKSGNAVFMTIIVIMLLSITFLLGFKEFQARSRRAVCKSASSPTDSRIHIGDAEMQLM